MVELYNFAFNHTPLAEVIFNFFLINLGMFISVAIHVQRGIHKDGLSPKEFNLNYFLQDNLIRIITTGIVMLISWMFMAEFTAYFADYIPIEFARMTPFIIGLLNDRIYLWIDNLTKK